MNKVKKILMMVLSLVLVAAMSIGGTVAYLQDDDSDVNVMTLGNVKIEQREYERVVKADGNYETKEIDGVFSYVLKDFTQGKALLPSAVVVSSTPWDSTVVRMTQVDSYGSMQTFLPVTNAQDKFVVVKNTGKTDAYIRTLVAIEVGSAEPSLISFSTHLTWEDNGIGTITIDGNNYYLHEFTYTGGKHLGGQHEKGILPAGETSYPSLSQVYIKPEATNEDMVALDGNGNGTLDILVVSQAVQVAGFANAEAALNAGFGDITTTNHPWTDGVDLTPTRNPATFTVATTEEAQAALDAAIPGDTIEFVAGNTYGTLYFRQSEASEIVRDYDYVQSEYDEVKIRTFENLTIKGNGAKIDGFVTEAGTYYNTAHSNSAIYPILDSFIKLENVKVDDVAFTGNTNAFFISGKTSVDGLTVTHCTMNLEYKTINECVFMEVVPNGAQPEYANVNGETFKVQFKNATIDNCQATYLDRFVLAHISENLTVTNCKLANTDNHFINLQGATGWDVAHTGTITITDNDFTNGYDRFFRAAKVGNAHIVLERNDVFNAFWENTAPDPELVKVDVVAGTSVTYTNVQNGFGTYTVVVQ